MLQKHKVSKRFSSPRTLTSYICTFLILKNLINRLFSRISSDESTLDQGNNEHSTNKQPKKDEHQTIKDFINPRLKRTHSSTGTVNITFRTAKAATNGNHKLCLKSKPCRGCAEPSAPGTAHKLPNGLERAIPRPQKPLITPSGLQKRVKSKPQAKCHRSLPPKPATEACPRSLPPG